MDIIDTGNDLNAYAKVENQSGCCSPAMESALPVGFRKHLLFAPPRTNADLHRRLADLLARYNVNDYAASVRVYRHEASLTVRTIGDSQ